MALEGNEEQEEQKIWELNCDECLKCNSKFHIFLFIPLSPFL
jgi:hypothetical protein